MFQKFTIFDTATKRVVPSGFSNTLDQHLDAGEVLLPGVQGTHGQLVDDSVTPAVLVESEPE